MKCFHCGENLNKSDIFCIKCTTPVLTEDDAALVNYSKALPNVEHDAGQYSDTMQFISETPPDSKQSQNTQPKNTQPKITQQGRAQTEKDKIKSAPPKKGKSRTFVIVTTIAVCIALIGIGLFFLVWFPQLQQDGRTPAISDNGTDDGTDAETDNGTDLNADLNADLSQAGPGTDTELPSQEITAINIFSGGRVQTQFHAMVNETITLSARIVPEGVDADITWTSSDPEVLEVVQVDARGLEARITGLTVGVADIIVSAGGFEHYYVVFVDNFPMHLQLESAIESDGTPILLTILWSSGPYADENTYLERDGDSQAWTMSGAYRTGEINPIFDWDDNALTITIPTSSRMFFLFADSGNFKYPDGTDRDDFFWWFTTIQIEPEG